MIFKRVLAAFLALFAAIFTFASCSGKENEASPENSQIPTEPATSFSDTEPVSEFPEETVPDETEPEGKYNSLTGLYDLDEDSPTRPIAFMIGNNPPSRPQYGINQADLFFETETEGGITRIMAVFASLDKVPDQIGPIRSGRTPFINLANALDALYIHCGASVAGFSAISNTGIAEIDALYSNDFWRDPYLRDNKGYEYSLMTSRDMLCETVMGGNFNTYASNDASFEFKKQKSPSIDASKIEIEQSFSETISFTYDVANNIYYKQLGPIDDSSRHLMADGSAIAVENIIVIYDYQYDENDVTINYELSGGNAKLFTGGTVREINWQRDTKQLSFYETDGSKALLNPGKTYVVIASYSHESAMKYY